MAGQYQNGGMVDVSDKNVTKREALAEATIFFSKNGFKEFIENGSPKGDVLEVAKVAGVLGAKAVPSVIPMCHPLELSKVKLDFVIDNKDYKITVRSAVSYRGRTGVEIEALTAVSIAALTIYDMMKWADKGMEITGVKLIEKTGGKSGDYRRAD